MNSSPIVTSMRRELQDNIDEKTLASSQRFFKEPVKCYGIKTAIVGKIAKKYWQEAKTLSKLEIFALCEELYRSDVTEEAFVVSFWLPNLVDKFERSDLAIFERWIISYINNWAKCDGFCNHTVGDFIEKFPDCIAELKRWAQSENRWLKRAAAVSLIIPAKHGEFLQEALEVSNLLLADEDDMVQKGYGWLLKEESRRYQAEVYNYILKNKRALPRTALRYAIELMPKELKAEAMKK